MDIMVVDDSFIVIKEEINIEIKGVVFVCYRVMILV